MAATDQQYRTQRTLDFIFGLSCGAMLLTTLWMLAQDFNRPFRAIQRKFRDVEATAAERDMVEKLPDPEVVKEKRFALRNARVRVDRAKEAVKPVQRGLTAQREAADDTYRAIK